MATLSYADLRDRIDEFLVERRREILSGFAAIAIVGGLGATAYWWFEVRWKPPPSIFDTPVDDVLGYLALDDFNTLSLEERMRFLLEFADRFRGLSQSESAVMAGFLAGLSGPAREQLTQNARQLAKDILAQGADRYLALPAAERAKFLDEWLLEWTKLGERLATGEVSDTPDQERLRDIKEDAKRDANRERDAARIPLLNDRSASRFLDFWSSDVESASSPKEQGQITRFMEDLRKHVLR
jgi:hypothetical protein